MLVGFEAGPRGPRQHGERAQHGIHRGEHVRLRPAQRGESQLGEPKLQGPQVPPPQREIVQEVPGAGPEGRLDGVGVIERGRGEGHHAGPDDGQLLQVAGELLGFMHRGVLILGSAAHEERVWAYTAARSIRSLPDCDRGRTGPWLTSGRTDRPEWCCLPVAAS